MFSLFLFLFLFLSGLAWTQCRSSLRVMMALLPVEGSRSLPPRMGETLKFWVFRPSPFADTAITSGPFPSQVGDYSSLLLSHPTFFFFFFLFLPLCCLHLFSLSTSSLLNPYISGGAKVITASDDGSVRVWNTGNRPVKS